jgi:hypothetical protein
MHGDADCKKDKDDGRGTSRESALAQRALAARSWGQARDGPRKSPGAETFVRQLQADLAKGARCQANMAGIIGEMAAEVLPA